MFACNFMSSSIFPLDLDCGVEYPELLHFTKSVDLSSSFLAKVRSHMACHHYLAS